MIGKLTLCCFAFLMNASLTPLTAQDQAKQALPPARLIPGVTAPDLFPNSCIDCHINHPEMKMDARFSTQMALWNEKVDPALLAKAQAAAPEGMILKGKHPKTGVGFTNIPAQCINCHGRDSEGAPPFSRMMHLIHLTGGDQNRFLTLYHGECTNCHKLNLTTGRWAFPSGPEK
jgi:mono/diheme cytochrome c family protein